MSGRLRVVGGMLSGRRFASDVARVTRPTSDRVREAIASAVESRGGFEDARVLDLFAGTGAMAFEALSRGAAHAWLVERDRAALRGIEASAKALGLTDRVTVVAADLGTPAAAVARLPPSTFDRVFADPPYALVALVAPVLVALAASGRLAEDALVVLEHPKDAVITLDQAFEILGTKRYGDSAVLFARYHPPR